MNDASAIKRAAGYALVGTFVKVGDPLDVVDATVREWYAWELSVAHYEDAFEALDHGSTCADR